MLGGTAVWYLGKRWPPAGETELGHQECPPFELLYKDRLEIPKCIPSYGNSQMKPLINRIGKWASERCHRHVEEIAKTKTKLNFRDDCLAGNMNLAWIDHGYLCCYRKKHSCTWDCPNGCLHGRHAGHLKLNQGGRNKEQIAFWGVCPCIFNACSKNGPMGK